MRNYDVTETAGMPIKSWTRGVPFEAAAMKQVRNCADLPFIFKHIAVMPDVHWGFGATVGSVIPTIDAIIPAAVGVDIGCGMAAVKTTLRASQLPDTLADVRASIERAVPVGGPGEKGSWKEEGRHGTPASVAKAWREIETGWARIIEKHPVIDRGLTAEQLGTLGTGNHFIEVCLDQDDAVWVMLHSGSRGLGNRIGQYFIERAKEEMRGWHISLEDPDLAYLTLRSQFFGDYIDALGFAQGFAKRNRELMMDRVLDALREHLPPFQLKEAAIDCHHNYVAKENHFGQNVFVTRKGAVRARAGDMGIIPGSMGARSYIVIGKGNPDSFCSCSHGAGRAMSRGAAKKAFTLQDHAAATAGIECRKDESVLDETPGAYKDIDAVMEAQKDLVDVAYELRQVVCVKG